MSFISLIPTENVDGWREYRVSFEAGLIVKAKPGKVSIEHLPHPLRIEVASDPDIVVQRITDALALISGGAGNEAEPVVTDGMVKAAVDAWYESPEPIEVCAPNVIAAALRARPRP